MLPDIESSPEYQRLIQKGRAQGLEQGLEQGLKQGLEQGKILGARQLLLSLVQTRFPSLVALAEKRLEPITDLEVLHQGVSQIGRAKTIKEARQYLQEL